MKDMVDENATTLACYIVDNHQPILLFFSHVIAMEFELS